MSLTIPLSKMSVEQLHFIIQEIHRIKGIKFIKSEKETKRRNVEIARRFLENEMTCVQLKTFLKETRKVKRYSKLNKAALIVRAVEGDPCSTPPPPPPDVKDKLLWKDLLEASSSISKLTKSNKLYRRVLDDDELLSNMKKCQTERYVKGSVRMPFWKPWVCVSFAAKDLQGSGVGCDDVDDSKAGKEPWGLCDYLRDAMIWPQDFMYIDAEQCGWYNVDEYVMFCGHYSLNRLTQQKHRYDWRTDTHKGYRNWKRAYTWAQRESVVMLYFMSKSWLSSPNCIGELSNFVNDILSSKIKTPPSLVIVTLDGEIENDRKTIPWNLMHSKLPDSFHEFVKRYEDMDRFRVMDFASDFLSCVRYQCIRERTDLDSSRIRLLVPARTVFDLSLYVVFFSP